MAKKKKVTLGDEMVKFLRDDYQSGMDKDTLAANYGVGRRTVERIVNNESRYSEEYAAKIGQPPKGEVAADEGPSEEKDTEPAKSEPEKDTPPPEQPPPPVIVVNEEPPVVDDKGTHIKLSAADLNLIKSAMKKVGVENIDVYCEKALMQITLEYLKMPIRCTFSSIRRRTIRG